MAEELQPVQSVKGNAAQRALEFGLAQTLLEAGHAYGFNVVTGYSELPTRDLDPVYVRLNGIEAAFLMDALSYAWDADGLVVSSDLLYLGATGYYGEAPPSSSWVRLPVPVSGLNPSPIPSDDVEGES
jgi:hypothetical protein